MESKTLKLLEEKNVGYYYNIKEGNKVQDVHTKQKGKQIHSITLKLENLCTKKDTINNRKKLIKAWKKNCKYRKLIKKMCLQYINNPSYQYESTNPIGKQAMGIH